MELKRKLRKTSSKLAAWLPRRLRFSLIMLMWLILLWRDSSPRAAAAIEYAISLLEWYGHDEDHRVYSGVGPTAAPNSLCLDDDDGDDVYDQSYGLDEYEWENERGRDS